MENFYIKNLCAVNFNNIEKNEQGTNGAIAKILNQKICPVGEVEGRDGRFFRIDGQKLIDELNQSGLDLPLNEMHADRWMGLEAARSRGWLNNFKLIKSGKNKGVYADINLNELGKDVIKNNYHRYLSPELMVDTGSREVDSIIACALVSSPNLVNTALNQTDSKNLTLSKTENIMEKSKSINTENQQLKSQLEAANLRLTELEKQLNETLIDNAVSTGKLLPAKVEFAKTLEPNSLKTYLATEASTIKVTDNNDINPDSKELSEDEQNPIYQSIINS